LRVSQGSVVTHLRRVGNFCNEYMLNLKNMQECSPWNRDLGLRSTRKQFYAVLALTGNAFILIALVLVLVLNIWLFLWIFCYFKNDSRSLHTCFYFYVTVYWVLDVNFNLLSGKKKQISRSAVALLSLPCTPLRSSSVPNTARKLHKIFTKQIHINSRQFWTKQYCLTLWAWLKWCILRQGRSFCGEDDEGCNLGEICSQNGHE